MSSNESVLTGVKFFPGASDLHVGEPRCARACGCAGSAALDEKLRGARWCARARNERKIVGGGIGEVLG